MGVPGKGTEVGLVRNRILLGTCDKVPEGLKNRGLPWGAIQSVFNKVGCWVEIELNECLPTIQKALGSSPYITHPIRCKNSERVVCEPGNEACSCVGKTHEGAPLRTNYSGQNRRLPEYQHVLSKHKNLVLDAGTYFKSSVTKSTGCSCREPEV